MRSSVNKREMVFPIVFGAVPIVAGLAGAGNFDDFQVAMTFSAILNFYSSAGLAVRSVSILKENSDKDNNALVHSFCFVSASTNAIFLFSCFCMSQGNSFQLIQPIFQMTSINVVLANVAWLLSYLYKDIPQFLSPSVVSLDRVSDEHLSDAKKDEWFPYLLSVLGLIISSVLVNCAKRYDSSNFGVAAFVVAVLQGVFNFSYGFAPKIYRDSGSELYGLGAMEVNQSRGAALGYSVWHAVAVGAVGVGFAVSGPDLAINLLEAVSFHGAFATVAGLLLMSGTRLGRIYELKCSR